MKLKPMHLKIFTLFTLLISASSQAGPKKFHRALVLGGGGVSPAVALGILQGLEDKGWKPDVVITTCGSSLSTALLAAYKTNDAAMDYAASPEFHAILRHLRVHTRSALRMKGIFDDLRNEPEVVPNFFEDTLMDFPESGQGMLPDTAFPVSPTLPRLIMVAARAHFDPSIARTTGTHPQFSETYFTDSDTASVLQDYDSPIKKVFPQSFIDQKVEVITDRTVGEAARASISDPFLLNPGRLGKDYFFTGAIDLVPIDLAHDLADEVISTSNGGFKDYEDLAIERTFGFKQSDSSAYSRKDLNTTYLEPLNVGKRSFDPKNFLIWFRSRVPRRLRRFERRIQAQYDYGYWQATESLENVKK